MSSAVESSSRLGVLARNIRLVREAAGKSLILVGAVQVIGAVLGGVLLVAAGQVIDGLSGDAPDWGATWPWIVALAVVTTLTGVFTAVGTEQQALIAEMVAMHTSERLIAAGSRVPFEMFDQPSFYNRMQRASEGSRGSATTIVWATLAATRTVIESVVIVALLLAVVPLVIPIALAAYVPLYLTSRRGNRIQHRFRWAMTEDDRHRAYLSSVFADRDTAREVRMFDLGRYFGAKHSELWRTRLAELRTVVRRRIMHAGVGALVSSAMIAGALGFVAWLASRGDISLAAAGIGILGAHRLGGAAGRLNSHTSSLHQSGLQMQDYDRFLAEAEAAALLDEGADVPDRVAEITLEDVSFRYAGSDVDALSHIDLTLRAGEITALVGTNGSGKSTLMMVLCGLYPPTTGRVLWDGVDVSGFRPSALRSAVAPMFQDFTRYRLTARQNVVVSDLDAETDTARTMSAIDRAGAAPVVDRLDDGLATKLSRAYVDGTELSAGQWQRLAVARAFFHAGPLLILDEPSADLDPLAEREIIEELATRSEDRIVMIISHRFSAVRRAHRIIVLNDGRLVEQGDHERLLDSGGIYAAMYRTQVGEQL